MRLCLKLRHDPNICDRIKNSEGGLSGRPSCRSAFQFQTWRIRNGNINDSTTKLPVCLYSRFVQTYLNSNLHKNRVLKFWNKICLIELEILTAVVMKSPVSWNTTRYSPLEINRRFGGTYRFSLLPASRWCLVCLTLRPRRWGWYVPPKRRLIFKGVYGVIFQKLELFKICLLSFISRPTQIFLEPASLSTYRINRCKSTLDLFLRYMKHKRVV
jgi:hypothetical protein